MVLIFVKHRKPRGGKRPMSAIVKHTTTNPVNMEDMDENPILTAFHNFYYVQEKYENSRRLGL